MADSVLIIGPSWVGDMVLAQSLFKVLKQQQPDRAIDVAAPAWTLPLLQRMPEVRTGIALPFKHGQLALGDRFRLGRQLKRNGYGQVILLTNSLKSALLPFFTGISKRTGYVGEMRYGLLNDIRRLDKQRLPRTVDRFVALAQPDEAPATILQTIPNPELTADPNNAKTALAKLGLGLPREKVLGLCPGAEYGEAKRWPAGHYAAVANAALDAGWQVWLFGSGKDIPVTAEIQQLCAGRCTDLGGKTALGEAIDLMALCDTVISNDSGLMHVAAALGKRLIAIYGSSDPHHTPPMSEQAVIEYLGLTCSPCFQRTCPLGHLNCLNLIPPERIVSNIISHRGSAI